MLPSRDLAGLLLSEILCDGIAKISSILEKRAGKNLRPIDCLDIMNIIGSVVVAGNVRRSAQLAIGDPDDVEYLLNDGTWATFHRGVV